MKKTIEIPEGYEARIEGNKVILEKKESENEQIRKEIIFLLKNADSGKELTTLHSTKEMIAYLEQQKEQKSLNISAASEWLRENVRRYINSEYNEFHKCVEYDGSIDKERLINDFEEAMQKQQQPIEEVIKNITKNKEAATKFLKSAGIMDDNGELAEMYRSEQKPAEWSEKDKKQLNWLIEHFSQSGELYHDLILWLKSFPERFNPQPKKEWSEEDEEMMRQVIGSIDTNISDSNFKNIRIWFEAIKDRVQSKPSWKPTEWSEDDERNMYNIIEAIKYTYDVSEGSGGWRLINYLKFRLRPQSHWKPSEEQMEELLAAIEYLDIDGHEDTTVLSSLYKDLRKNYSYEYESNGLD